MMSGAGGNGAYGRQTLTRDQSLGSNRAPSGRAKLRPPPQTGASMRIMARGAST